MSEARGPFLRVLAFIEGVFEFGERLWTFLVVGGLFAGAAVLYVLYLIKS